MSSTVVLILLFLSPAAVLGRTAGRRDDNKTKDEDEQLLERMTDAVERGLRFFAQDYSSINVDGLFGMRVGQGQIMQALKECKGSRSCPESLEQRLQALSEGIEQTAAAAMKYVEDGDTEYFNRFLATVNNPYLLKYKPTTLKALGKTPAGTDTSYDEETGDDCLARIMGTFTDHGKKTEQCNVTKSCWNMMTEPNRGQYSITHQLLYFIIVEKQGCLEVVESSMGAKVAETEERMCGSIYNEAASEVEDGHVPQMNQDLFLEQVLLCGSLGFENFMQREWMKMVLKWQKPTGCFSLDNQALLSMEKQLSEYQNQERKLMTDLKWEVAMIEKQHQQHHGRKLLREQVMNDGCLSHKSGLGFGTLCLFNRFLVRQTYLNQGKL